jgi:hypothetical protein
MLLTAFLKPALTGVMASLTYSLKLRECALTDQLKGNSFDMSGFRLKIINRNYWNT